VPVDKLSQLLLDLLEEQENQASRLYAIYAIRFPEQRDLWERMSRDEVNHARWINGIRKAVDRGEAVVNPDVLRIEEVRKLAKILADQIARTEQAVLLPADAIRAAAEIEGSMLEESFPRVFESKREKIRKLLTRLQDETARHSKQVAELLEKYGKAVSALPGTKLHPRK
jgi:rubrerythrin